MRIFGFLNPTALSLCLVISFGAAHVTDAKASTATSGAARGVPTFEVQSICGRVSGVVETRDGCKEDEQGARDQLIKDWNEYPAADRSNCTSLTSTGGLPSYVELLTCLELASYARQLPKQ